MYLKQIPTVFETSFFSFSEFKYWGAKIKYIHIGTRQWDKITYERVFVWYFFTWNILLLSYINKIEAVTLKHIKKKKFNQSSFSTSTKNPPKKQKQKKTHKKSIESQKVLILMIYLLILWILIFVSFFQNNFSTSS